jgi:hypothetical protein
MSTPDFSPLVARHRAYVRTGATRSTVWREGQLTALRAMMTDRAKDFHAALWTDLRRIQDWRPRGFSLGGLNAAWVNLPIIRTQKLPIHIDRQYPAASCEIRLMPTPMSRNGGDFPGVLRSVDRRERPRSTAGTVVAFSLACLIKQYLIIGSVCDE